MRLIQCLRAAVISVRYNLLVVLLPSLLIVVFAASAASLEESRWGSRLPSARDTLGRAAADLPALELCATLGYPGPIGPINYNLWLSLAFLLLQTLLDAGMIVFLANPILNRRARRFFPLAKTYAGRFTRILVLGLGLSTLLIAPAMLLFKFALPMQFREAHSTLWAAVALLGILFAVETVAGYVRMQTILEERTSMLLAWFSALRFVCQNPGSVLGISLLRLAQGGLFLALGGAWQRGLLPTPATSPLTLGLLLAAVWLGSWLRGVSYGAAIALARSVPDAGGVRLYRREDR